MYLTGFADEAADGIDGQIRATKTLGWKNIESRNVDGQNLTNLPDARFDEIAEKLAVAGLHVNCFGSAIANWAKKLNDPPESSYDEMRRAIPRMKRLGTQFIRVMSFNVPWDGTGLKAEIADEVIRRMRVIVKMAEDANIICVHENCDNWGGQSPTNSLRLLAEINSPHFKLVFDTGNPVGSDCVEGKPPYRKQDALEYYRAVKIHIAYVHIKDAVIENEKKVFTFPGEGDGHVAEILKDLCASGYDGGISIEPHLAVVHHDPKIKSPDDIRFANYVEYGTRMGKLVQTAGWKSVGNGEFGKA